jgi:hypothetical protein
MPWNRSLFVVLWIEVNVVLGPISLQQTSLRSYMPYEVTMFQRGIPMGVDS